MQAQGFYFFYHLFKFIGGLALFLAVLCFGVLAYLLFQLMRGSSPENQKLIKNEGVEMQSQGSMPTSSRQDRPGQDNILY